MAIVNELGMERLCGVMGSGISTVSLSACHLLQVMFEALTEGMKKDVRGKDEAILPGECPLIRSGYEISKGYHSELRRNCKIVNPCNTCNS